MTLGVIPVGGRSHVVGDTGEKIWDITIPALLQEVATRHGDRLAAVFSDRDIRWTYREFAREVDMLATSLLGLGLVPGDRVGIWSPNSPEWLTVQFATARIGAILVTINPAYRIREAEYVLEMVGIRALFLGRRFKSSDYVGMMSSIAPDLAGETGNASRLPELEFCIHTGDQGMRWMLDYRRLLENGREIDHDGLERLATSLAPDQPINIQFTSGTTGAPKGATLTHRNIVNNARFVATTLRMRSIDCLCIPVPLYHCFGMVMGSLACVTTGATMVFPAAGFEAASTLDAVARERCTALYGVPTMFVAMLDELDRQPRDLSSLRTGIMAGAPCPMEIMRKVIGTMNMREITIAYGMTETSPVSFQSHVNDPLERKVGTVGRVHPHVEARIIDREGRTVGVGEQGELCTRGYAVMAGYWSNPEATSDAIDRDGWMHTGDLAVIDDGGYCRVVGRLSDMVVRGGENIYPREIEEFLYTHPAVREVQVFGVPDRVMGEEVCAWIVAGSEWDVTEADLREFCAGNIAHFKIPRYFSFRDSLPLTVTGKPQKFLMRRAMIKELGLDGVGN